MGKDVFWWIAGALGTFWLLFKQTAPGVPQVRQHPPETPIPPIEGPPSVGDLQDRWDAPETAPPSSVAREYDPKLNPFRDEAPDAKDGLPEDFRGSYDDLEPSDGAEEEEGEGEGEGEGELSDGEKYEAEEEET